MRKRWLIAVAGLLVAIPLTPPLALTTHPWLTQALAGPKGFDMACLALNIYRERATAAMMGVDESVDGLMAIGWTVKTRKGIDFHQKDHAPPESLCDVVYARLEDVCQYTWTCKPGAFAAYRTWDMARSLWAAAMVVWELPPAMAVWRTCGPADHYINHATSDAKWWQRMTWACRQGFHDFYVEHGRYPTARRKYIQAIEGG